MFLTLLACNLLGCDLLPSRSRPGGGGGEETPELPARSPPRSDCDDRSHVEDPVVDGCVTAEIACGETIQGHTTGGLNNWSDAFYSQKFCIPSGNGYGGPERVYRLHAPAENYVLLELDSPCEDLDLVVVSWNGPGCPGMDHNVAECEGSETRGDDDIKVFLDRNPRTYLVTVDGKGGVEAPFSLTVRCAPHG